MSDNRKLKKCSIFIAFVESIIAFKTKVVLEALKEQKTLAQLGSEFGVSPNQISLWKNDIIKNLPTLFGAKSTDLTPEKEEENQQKRIT